MSRPSLPFYFRVLRLRHIAPGRWASLVLFEGSVVVGLVLALAELINGWGVLVLPVTVAVMVKFNDLVAGALRRAGPLAPVRVARPIAAPTGTGVAGPARSVARAVGRCPVPPPGSVARAPGLAIRPHHADPPPPAGPISRATQRVDRTDAQP